MCIALSQTITRTWWDKSRLRYSWERELGEFLSIYEDTCIYLVYGNTVCVLPGRFSFLENCLAIYPTTAEYRLLDFKRLISSEKNCAAV